MKKNLFIPLLSALIALSGCAAAGQVGDTVPTSTTVTELTATSPSDTEIVTTEPSITELTKPEPLDDYFLEVPFAAQYIYTGSCAEASFPDLRRIDSREALEEYYQQSKDIFELDTSYGNAFGFRETCKGYDEAFFEDRCLVMVLLEEGSGSNRHDVRQVRLEADGTLTISIDTLIPECGTCDMAQWHILLELPREHVPETTDRIMLFLDERLAWHKNPIRPSSQIDTSRLTTPPDGTLYHSNGSTPLVEGGFNWSVTGEDGTVSTLMADALHPLQFGDLLTPITPEGDYVKLDFEQMPDTISVRCWPDTALGSDSIPDAITVPTTQNTFEPLSGGYVYEITANWSEAGRLDYGTATYGIYLIAK